MRQYLLRILLAVLVCSAVLSCSNSTAAAQIYNSHTPAGVSVTLNVPATTINVNALTFPDSFVSLEDNGSVAATGLSDANGNISLLLPALTPGFQSLSVYAIDPNNITSDSVNFSVNITAHTNTVLNEFLPPTIAFKLLNSDAPSLYGYSAPGSTISAYIDTSRLLSATAQTNGYWSINLYKSNIQPGQHTVFAVANLNSQASNFTRIVSFNMPHIVISKPIAPVIANTPPAAANRSVEALINQQLPWKPLVRDTSFNSSNSNQLKSSSEHTLIVELVVISLIVVVATVFTLSAF